MATANDLSENIVIEANCVELALEGQRLCRSGDIKLGIKFFETALTLGTEDLNILMVVYSQLGNAYFSAQDYGKSLHYHRLDLDLSRRLGELCGEGKASGNLGNTLKMLGKYEEAITCCEHHLSICRQLNDKSGVVRALYNLANVYHNQAKTSGAIGRQDVGQFPIYIQEALEKAASYYEENLLLSKEIEDRSTQALACGNLANTHYLLGNFQKAVELHTERLTLAKEFGHRAAERRAYSNRGNAYIFLANFEAAIDDYKNALRLAKELKDETLEAQVSYSLGNTYYILRQYSDAAVCLENHLTIAKKLSDKVGEARACWSLTNIHCDGDDCHKAKMYAAMHLEIASELGDSLESNTALENLKKLDIMMQHTEHNQTDDVIPSVAPVVYNNGLNRTVGGSLKIAAINKPNNSHLSKSNSHGTLNKCKDNRKLSTYSNNGTKDNEDNEDDFFSLLSKYQSRRMDEQRCSFHLDETEEDLTINGKHVVLSQAQREFLDLLAGVQGARMNDQRASMPEFPGLRASPHVLSQLLNCHITEGDGDSPNDAFFDMVMRCQATRIEDQRSNLPDPLSNNNNLLPDNHHHVSVTVPDEDLFTRILRLQSSRLDEQRCSPPIPLPSFSLSTVIDDGDGVPEPAGPDDRHSQSNEQIELGAVNDQYSCRGSRCRR